MFKNLRNKLLLFNMAIISFVMVAAFASIYFITYNNIQKENQRKLESIPRISIGIPGVFGLQGARDNQSNSRVTIRLPVGYSPSFTILLSGDGQVMDVMSYIDIPNEAYYQIAKKAWESGDFDGTVTLESRKWQYHISSFENLKVLRDNDRQRQISSGIHYQMSFLDVTDSSRTLTQLLITFIIVGIAMLFILFGVSYNFANRSIQPIEENWEKQKQFVADASHELKTPLAIINANSDALLANGEETVNSQRRWINYIQSETGRMVKLVNDMLYLAKVEDTMGEKIPFDMSNTVLDVIASMEAITYEKGINLTHTIEPGIIVKGDSEKIKQVIIILLDNATKYANVYGDINITLTTVKDQAVFSVENSGTGIPQDKLPRIFDRFYRCDPSRSKETGGYGLGLSIAKAVIERSGGSINVQSTEKRTIFTFVLKINK